jgi:hypothetical protein
MRKVLLILLSATALAVSQGGAGQGQKKQAKCEESAKTDQNWVLMGQDYVYFDYVVCPADMNPASPLVRIWITTNGDGIALEKWAQERDGADNISLFHGKKKAYTLYRDLSAIPLKVFKSESRAGVSAEVGSQPFLAEGPTLAPLENLTPESVDRAKKVFENADVLIRKAQSKLSLNGEPLRIVAIVDALDKPLKLQP